MYIVYLQWTVLFSQKNPDVILGDTFFLYFDLNGIGQYLDYNKIIITGLIYKGNTNMSQYTPAETQIISPTLQLEWYANKTIVSYIPSKITPDTLSTWSEKVYEILSAWSDNEPYLALHDFSHKGTIITYSAISRNRILNIAITDAYTDKVDRLIESRANFEARIAILMSTAQSGHLGKVFSDLEALRQVTNHIEYKVFHEKEHALTWLASPSNT